MFSGEGKVRKVKDDRGADDKAGGDDAKKDAPAEAKGDDAKGDDAKKEDGDGATPPPVPPKQGGCGCVVAGDEVPGEVGALALAALGAVVMVRRAAEGLTPNFHKTGAGARIYRHGRRGSEVLPPAAADEVLDDG